MYSPLFPNSYRDVKVALWKRAREEEQKSSVAGVIVPDGGHTLPLHLSAEELHQRRVRQSAAMGISTAMQLMRDDLVAAHKTKVAEGTDRKGRIRQKLGKLLDVAAAEKSGTDGESAAAKGALPDVFAGTLPGSGAPLVFQRAELAAGGYVVKAAGGDAGRRRAPRGKPSSTILIRFVSNGPPVDMFDSNDSSAAEARGVFLEAIQDECGQCGVVRSVRYALLSKDEQLALRAALEKKEEIMKAQGGNGAAAADLNMLLAREMIRVFVRFDAVANAFKTLEMLQQKHGVDWDVCFFPTQLFDAGALGPAEGESLCGG